MTPRPSIKQDLRKISEIAIVGILGRVPRKLRRAAGRTYANAAYRDLQGLAQLNHSLSGGGQTLIKWVIREYEGIQKLKVAENGKAVVGAESTADDVGSTASRPTDRDSATSSSPNNPNEG